ncbi:MAG: hypothetical protein KatS3mg051_2150 [Anaerolineae bacterium]|nr:MAG: hypothetical protein KatS3mg051_1821 [Anaerolineae bacterium]GIV82759.1 MAG: hypothetical protein KatS3mg051_2113 [Anaerolineae bacterium]GIV82796.1 MAG: hypothetical protein KatS3mg051_2150 [Anaerolineae bacterium]
MGSDLPERCWVIMWRHYGRAYLLDVAADDEAFAAALACEIAESGREDVMVVEAALPDVDPETRARIWDRVQARLEREMPEWLRQAVQ